MTRRPSFDVKARSLHVVDAGRCERGLGEWIRIVTFPDDYPKFRVLTRQPQAFVISDTQTSEASIEIPETSWISSHIAAPLPAWAKRQLGCCASTAQCPIFILRNTARGS